MSDLINDSQTTLNAIFGFSIFKIGLAYLVWPFQEAGSAAGSIGNLVRGAFNWPSQLSFLTDSLAYLVVAVAILIAMFRTLFALIMAWVSIIINTIFAPLMLLMNAFPGSNMFGVWIKGLIAHAAVFPAVASMLIIGAILVGGERNTNELGVNPQIGAGYGAGGWVPPLVTSGVDTTGTNAVRSIIGLGMLLLLPETVKIIRELLGVKEGFGEMAWQNLQRGAAPVQKVGRFAGSSAIGYGDYVVEKKFGSTLSAPWWVWRGITRFGRT
jgi:hypothetical protein